MTVWSALACTGCPLMKISGMDRSLEVAGELRALLPDPVLEFVAILVEDADRRVAGGVTHAADRHAVLHARDAVQAVDVLGPAFAGDDTIDDPVQPAHALAAWCALAAGLVVVEAQHHLQQAHHA